MTESEVTNKLFDRLTEPIREKPISSLFFFAFLLAAGYFGQEHLSVAESWRPILLALFFVIPSAGMVLSLHRLFVMGDAPSRLIKPAVLDEIKNSFVGRDEDVRELTEQILNSYQIWLNGDSGVGKSVLLQKGVLPALEKQNVVTVYLNNWRGDWEFAPAAALLARLNVGDAGNALDTLPQVLASLPGRVIILDQFDEFQIEHKDKFILGRGRVISRAQLEDENRFIRILNAAARDRLVHCVFVTRRDVEWGKRAVLFEGADEMFLKRLERNVVEGEIARIVTPEAVWRPENGWDALRDKLCNDLADDGILPVQMRFAVLGLDELRHNLTVSAYMRIGGVRGLVSRYIEHEVRRLVGVRSLALLVFPLLEKLVTPDGKATASVAEDELLKLVGCENRDFVVEAFEQLERRDIVRRVISPDGIVLWRLDHDYLAGPVREISRRQLPEQWELREHLQRYQAASPWLKPLKLAAPGMIAKMLYARLFKGLRFGPAISWYSFSLAGLFVMLSGLTYIGFGGYRWFADREVSRSLFSSFSSRFPEDTSDPEAKALLILSNSPLMLRQEFLEEALETAENADRLRSHRFALAIALSQTHASAADELYRRVIRRTLLDPQSDSEIMERALELISFWDTAESLSEPQARELASALVERMSQEKNADALRSFAYGLSALKKKIDSAIVQRAASALIERMSHENGPLAIRSLTDGLGALAEKIDPTTAQKLASTLVERMSQEENVYTLSYFGYGLSALREKIDPTTAQKLASTLVKWMSQEKDPGALRVFANGLSALREKIDPTTAQKLTSTLVARMSQEKDADALRSLADGLGALREKIDPTTAQKLASTLVARMSHEKGVDALHSLANGLGALREKIDPTIVQRAASTLVDRMNQEKDAVALYSLADGLGALREKIDPTIVQKAASTLVDRMNQEKDADALHSLADGLRALREEIDPTIVQRAASTLVDRMNQEKDADALDSLANGLGALREKIDPTIVQRAASTLVDRMNQEKDAVALHSLADGLGALREKIDPTIVQKAASTLADRMNQEKDAVALHSLADGLGALREKIDPATAQKVANTLVGRMSQEKDADALRSLAHGLGALKSAGLSKSELPQVESVFRRPNAPCSTLLAFDGATQRLQLPKQLKNPLCVEGDWKQLALHAAQTSGRPIAFQQPGRSEIVVDFAKLSDYVWASEPWYKEYKPTVPEIASLVLFISALVALAFGLLKSSEAMSFSNS